MKTNDLVLIGSAALATATLTVAGFLPASLGAGDGSAPDKITQPKLVSHGVEFTLAAEQPTFRAGDEPVFVLKAVNTTGGEVGTAVLVSMTAMAPPSALSRIPSFPQTLWQESCPWTLKANETNTLSLATATKLPPNSTIHIKLQPVDPLDADPTGKPNAAQPVRINDPSAIVALSFSTLPAPAAVALR